MQNCDDKSEKLCYNERTKGVVDMFRKLFAPDSDLMIVMTWITDCIFLSVFWILGCAPVVTIGASCAAVYDATYRTFHRKHKHSWQRFWRVWLDNWKCGILPGMFVVAAMAGVGWALIQAWNHAVLQNGWMLFAAVALVGAVVLGALSVILPMVSRFQNSAMRTIGNAFAVALANLPRTFLLGIVQAATIVACVYFVVPVVFLPALTALISSLLVEPMFRPYLPEDFYQIDPSENL